ncbi:MAG: Hsp20/alpha crystallin family protein [bacterium]
MNRSLIPFGSLRDLWDGSDIFDSFFPVLHGGKRPEKTFWSPSIDIYDKKDSLVVKAEIPGVDKKDIKLSIDGDILTISGESRNGEEVKEKDYYYTERSYGSFSRSIRLPGTVEKDKAKASFDKGVLTVELKKSKKGNRAVTQIKID